MVVQYRVCPVCGAHLDFGERCDCGREKKEAGPVVSGRAHKMEWARVKI